MRGRPFVCFVIWLTRRYIGKRANNGVGWQAFDVACMPLSQHPWNERCGALLRYGRHNVRDTVGHPRDLRRFILGVAPANKELNPMAAEGRRPIFSLPYRLRRTPSAEL